MADARYSQPCPLFPESPITLDRLIWAWEKLRDLNTAGYRSSQTVKGIDKGMPTWLIGINWAFGSSTGPSVIPGTSCSPMTVQAMVMAHSKEDATPFHPLHADGKPVSALYNTMGNGNFRTSNKGHMAMAKKLGITDIRNSDNYWARANIFFNFAYAVEPKDMRRGDIVGIDWATGGGHATYCWDVHLNERGEADAFQYVSSNGSLGLTAEDKADGLTMGRGSGYGVSIGGVAGDKWIKQEKKRVGAESGIFKKVKSPYFADDEYITQHGSWASWIPEVAKKGSRGLKGMRVQPTGGMSLCRVQVARPHGIRPPEPYGMGGQPMPVPVHTPPVSPAQINKAEVDADPAKVKAGAKPLAQDDKKPTSGQLELETRLKMLYELQIIDKDPGEPDAVNDAKSQAAVKDFQTRNGIKPTGNADAKTKAKLKTVWQGASATDAGKIYIASHRGTRPAGGGAAPGQAIPAAAPGQAIPAAPAQAAPAAPAQAAPAAPAQAAPAQAAPAGGLTAGAKTDAKVAMYFRHGFARVGDAVAVVVHVEGNKLDGQRFGLKLKNVANGDLVETGAVLAVNNGHATVAFRVPGLAAGAGQVPAGVGREFIGVSSALGETAAPLYVPG